MVTATAKRPKSDAVPPDLPPAETIPPTPPPAAKPASGWTVPRVEVPVADQFSPKAADVVILANLPPAERFALQPSGAAVLQGVLAGASTAFEQHPDLQTYRQLTAKAASWRAKQREAEAVASDLGLRIDAALDGGEEELTALARQISDARLAGTEAQIRAQRFETEAAAAKTAAESAWRSAYKAAVVASKAALDRQLAERRQELADVLAEHVPAVVELQEATFALAQTRYVNPPAMPS